MAKPADCTDPSHHVHGAQAYVHAVEAACSERGLRLTPLRAQVLALVAAAGKPVKAYVGCHHPQVRHSVPFLICDQCQNAIELEDERIAELLESHARVVGFAPRAQTLEVHGTCAACLAAG